MNKHFITAAFAVAVVGWGCGQSNVDNMGASGTTQTESRSDTRSLDRSALTNDFTTPSSTPNSVTTTNSTTGAPAASGAPSSSSSGIYDSADGKTPGSTAPASQPPTPQTQSLPAPSVTGDPTYGDTTNRPPVAPGQPTPDATVRNPAENKTPDTSTPTPQP